jgi:hypothetical protein
MNPLSPESYTTVGVIVVMLILAILAGAKEVWVWGYHYRRVLKRVELLEELLFRMMGVTDIVVSRAAESNLTQLKTDLKTEVLRELRGRKE